MTSYGILLRVFDSPLVTYREPEPGVAEGPSPEQFQSVSDSFFTYLARDFDGQAIIMENTDPPAPLVERATLVHFTGSGDSGRYGFFPLNAAAPPADAAGSTPSVELSLRRPSHGSDRLPAGPRRRGAVLPDRHR